MYSLAVTPNGHLEGRGSLPPPLIMRTAATPMPTPKSSPHLDLAPGLLDSRRGSSSSVDPQLGDQKSLVRTLPCPSLRGPHFPGSFWPFQGRVWVPHAPQSHHTHPRPQVQETALWVSVSGAGSGCSCRRSFSRADVGARGPCLSSGTSGRGFIFQMEMKGKSWQSTECTSKEKQKGRRKGDPQQRPGRRPTEREPRGFPRGPGRRRPSAWPAAASEGGEGGPSGRSSPPRGIWGGRRVQTGMRGAVCLYQRSHGRAAWQPDASRPASGDRGGTGV